MVLQDAQTRLFFKAQAVIQSEIRHYVPKAEDLAWPDILVGKFSMQYLLRVGSLIRLSCEQAFDWDGNQGKGKHKPDFQKRVRARA